MFVGLFEGEDVTGGSVGLGVTTSGSEGLIDGDFDGDTEGLSDGLCDIRKEVNKRRRS